MAIAYPGISGNPSRLQHLYRSPHVIFHPFFIAFIFEKPFSIHENDTKLFNLVEFPLMYRFLQLPAIFLRNEV